NEAYRCDFLPADVRLQMIASGIDAAILVQTTPQVEETAWLVELARDIDWIVGITGWVDLDTERVDYAPLLTEPKLVGIRAQLRRIADAGFVRRPRVIRNIGRALEAGLGVTLLAEYRHYDHVADALSELPAGPVTFNHLGMAFPDVPREAWRRAMRRFAARPATFLQLSGLPFLAGLAWQQPDAQQLLDEALEIFGPDKLLFASDWPMMIRFTDYRTWVQAVEAFVLRHELRASDVAAIFGGNALAANPRLAGALALTPT
ncbi:MAG: amidohydrolase family protein, partial [Betaproteobacteria bacterium]